MKPSAYADLALTLFSIDNVGQELVNSQLACHLAEKGFFMSKIVIEKEVDLFGYLMASQFASDEEWAEIQEAVKVFREKQANTACTGRGELPHEWEFPYGIADNHCIYCGTPRQ